MTSPPNSSKVNDNSSNRAKNDIIKLKGSLEGQNDSFKCHDEKEIPQNGDQGVGPLVSKKNICGAPKWLWGISNGIMGIQLDQTC